MRRELEGEPRGGELEGKWVTISQVDTNDKTQGGDGRVMPKQLWL